ncbi:MAG: LamG domain-containing protein [Candidatus Poribacteria bacterium]|nr:LamG domain-containing protein [Candidatus Poribacteria bacterium]
MKRLMLLFTFTVIGFMLTVNASAKTIVTDGLVSYWTLDRHTINDKTVEDVWGENDATVVGNPKVVRGYLKQGLALDGVGDYVSLPNVGNFGSRIGPYTFEVWFKTSHKKRWSAIYKVNECGGNNNMGYGILINTTIKSGHTIYETKEDFLFTHYSTKSGNGCAGGAGGSEQPVSDGEWHHIVWTSRPPNQEELDKLRNVPLPPQIKHRPVDGGNCITSAFYLDMEPIADGTGCTLPNDIRPYTLPIFLGAVNDNGKNVLGFFQGVFDEVRIYDRALTHEEVIRNYESGIGLSVEPIQKLSTVWGALKKKR